MFGYYLKPVYSICNIRLVSVSILICGLCSMLTSCLVLYPDLYIPVVSVTWILHDLRYPQYIIDV